MQTKLFANSSHWVRGKLIFCEPEANTGHSAYLIPFVFVQKANSAYPIPFVFVQKTDKLWFVTNGMRTVRRWRSTGSQSYPHTYTHLVCELFASGL